MQPLNIVLATMESPLPFGDAASRWYNVLLTELTRRGHRLTTFTTCKSAAEKRAVEEHFSGLDVRAYVRPMKRDWASKARTFLRPNSNVFGEDIRRDFKARLSEGFDLLHFEQLWTGWLCDAHIDQTVVNIHFLSAIDLAGAPSGGLRDWLQRQRTFDAERRLIHRFRHFNALTGPIAEGIQKINPSADIAVAPLGLDLSLYPFIPSEKRQRKQPVVGLIGSMFWYPNISAANRLIERLWPAIHERVPSARLQIVGRQARQALANYVDAPGVTILENVPDIRPYFEELSVLAYAPRQGSGMKVKVLEAFSFGAPVVTTIDGVEGLPAVDGVHVGIGDGDEALVDRIVALLEDFDAQERQRLAARALMEEHCSPKATIDAIEARYAHLLGVANGR